MNEFGYHTSKRARRRSPRAKRGFGKRTATTTALWPGVRLINSSGRKIVVQWKQMPDGTRMALLMGDNISSISGDDDELGFIGALLSAAPALFSMVKKVAPGLMATAGKLAGKYLPRRRGKVAQGRFEPRNKSGATGSCRSTPARPTQGTGGAGSKGIPWNATNGADVCRAAKPR